MARVADTETAMRSMEAAPPRNNEPPPPSGCTLRKQLCFSALLLGISILAATALAMRLQGPVPRYESPEFNLTSLNASQPWALVLADQVVVSGWVACFSTRNPNPDPISYDQVNARLWAHRGRQFDQADVTPLEQAPGGADEVCASFPGAAMMEMESHDDKTTVWFDAVRLNATVTYKSDKASLHVVCEDVKVLVSSAVATTLVGGAKECRVKKKSTYPGGEDDHSPLSIALMAILIITASVFYCIILCCMMPPRYR